ncbi:MAG TPA: alpha/beta hydrolase [Gemmatimonas aurantiaca]|uniref:Alpha/beta hydrolase n=2 Tax=Gemmatimonas aurantiaca TaxID=173480 RepID=A0A3D4V7J3_9BACT|nr:alpha/beta fold hydrolase [Gemmatimonas aurantiaca]BAH38283.1 putative hydrolase [Gemmatimonas aurantiaca T-27]HCT57055.1 alpha/beta hydrolase [Gemmatimonas aurantiaca]
MNVFAPNDWPWPAKRHQTVDGALHYIDVGAGPAVCFVHGTPTSSYEWRHQIRALQDTHRCIALDHLGFGQSERPAHASYTPEAHAVRFRAFMDTHAPTEPFTLVVHDFGGPIALDWALDHPSCLARLVVVNTWMWSFEHDVAMWKQARLANSWLVRQLYRHLNASLRILMPGAYGHRARLDPAVHGYYQSLFPDADSRERVLFALARALTQSSAFFDRLWQRRMALDQVPMTILWGLADRAFPPPVLAQWRQAFPHADVTTFDGVGHWPHEESAPAFTAALVSALQPPS